jgi:hypothetical protein
MGAERESGADKDGVAEALERVRAGVRQRQSELACLDTDLGRLPGSLAAVNAGVELEEPTLEREGGSSLVDFVQKLTYHLFSRRHHRSLLQQQTRFNRSVALALEDLHTRQQRLGDALRELRDTLESSSQGPSG